MDSAENNDSSQLPPLELFIETAPGEGCFGHIPSLPGLCFRASDPAQLDQRCAEYIHNYIDWLIIEQLADLNPTVARWVSQASSAGFGSFHVIIKETKPGAPVWISGNAAALFNCDLEPLDDPSITAHLRFTRKVFTRISSLLGPLSQSRLAHKPPDEHRSIDDMLTHIGNCVWWYCSRIDDELPEPDEPDQEPPLARIERLLGQAERYLTTVPEPARNLIHRPGRFQTNDPGEQWTHTKVCRRQAEHMWEHLVELGGRL